MKYNIRIYEGSLPRKGIVPLNETGQMHGEEKIYEYMHKHPPRNLKSANVRGWMHVSSLYYTNGALIKRSYWYVEYEDSDFMGSGTMHHVKKEIRFEYDNDTCVVTLHKDGQLNELATKANGILHGKREIYWLDYDIPGDIKSYVWCEHYNYVNGLIEGPVAHIGRNLHKNDTVSQSHVDMHNIHTWESEG